MLAGACRTIRSDPAIGATLPRLAALPVLQGLSDTFPRARKLSDRGGGRRAGVGQSSREDSKGCAEATDRQPSPQFTATLPRSNRISILRTTDGAMLETALTLMLMLPSAGVVGLAVQSDPPNQGMPPTDGCQMHRLASIDLKRSAEGAILAPVTINKTT